MSKKKVLIAVDWFYPGFRAGGPIRSVVNLVERLKSEFDFYVLTGDTDLGEEKPYEGIVSDTWINDNGFQVRYCSSSPSVEEIKSFISDFEIDVVYLNSMFSPGYTLNPLKAAKSFTNVQVVLAPRGMLSPNALAIKALKKKVFLRYAKITGLFKSVLWHATSEEEEQNIRSKFTSATIHRVPNLALKPTQKIEPESKKPNQLKILTVSRIAPIKNLHKVYQVLQNVEADHKIKHTHVGPLEDQSYWEKCKSLRDQLPPNVESVYEGQKTPWELADYFSSHQLLMLLSESENYGHVVIEAMSYGMPVLISDRMPWQQLKQKGVGLELPLNDLSEFTTYIHYLSAQSSVEFNETHQKVLAYASSIIDDPITLEKAKQLFQ